MAEKKNKIAKKSTKTIATKSKQKPEAVVVENVETLFPANKIIDILNVPSFDYFIMQKQYGFDDGALFTIAQFKNMYKKAIEGR